MLCLVLRNRNGRLAAMDKEIQSIRDNDVWDLVELPKQRMAIGIFKRKPAADGSIERYKARLVAQGLIWS